MLEYAAIVPHHPLLLPEISGPSPVSTRVDKAFNALASDLFDRNIKKLFLIGSHAKVNRQGFSVYVDEHYQISFRDFGDLITNEEAKIWWEMYHKLRDIQPVIEPISSGAIDYGHALPLFKLSKLSKDFSAICIDTPPRIKFEEIIAFASELNQILKNENEPLALICSGDLFQTTKPGLTSIAHQQNDQIRTMISKRFPHDFLINTQEGLNEPCLSKPIQILVEVLKNYSFQYRELAFEHTSRTSFLLSAFDVQKEDSTN